MFGELFCLLTSDGASLCGLYLAVHNAIQQLDMDGGADVLTAVRQLQVRRPEFCANIVSHWQIYTVQKLQASLHMDKSFNEWVVSLHWKSL